MFPLAFRCCTFNYCDIYIYDFKVINIIIKYLNKIKASPPLKAAMGSDFIQDSGGDHRKEWRVL